MPILMTKYGTNEERYFTQDNNATEQIIKKKGIQLYLETCGTTSMANCIASIKDDEWLKNNFYFIKIQIEDYICDYMNDPHNYDVFKAIRNLDYNFYFGNEIPQLYPYTAKQLFNVDAEFKNEKDFNKLIGYISNNQPIQLCFINPGHFVALVGIDTDTKELIINDPWFRHYPTGGFNHRLSIQEYDQNINPWLIIYKN
jgi:hypothetical protein